MSEGWIELESAQPLSPIMQNIRGSRVTVYVSPHAVPRAVRAHFDRSAGVFRIDFRYLDGTDTFFSSPQSSKDGQVEIFVGKVSGRIERIDVRTLTEPSTLNLEIVVKRAERMLTEVSSSNPSLSLRLNAEAALSAVGSSYENFFTLPSLGTASA